MRFLRFFRENQSPRLTRRTTRFRPMVEGLEDRSLMATVFVTPIDRPIDATHRHSLVDAMPFAGANGTVVIEPGATPDVGAVIVSLNGLTITGDAGFAPAGLPQYDLTVTAPFVSLTNLNLGTVTLAAISHHVTVSRSQLGSLTETGGTTGVGNNLITHNLITGAVDLQGNSGALQSTGDVVAYNRFASSGPVILKLANSNNSTVKENTVLGSANSQVGIQVRSNSDGVVITNNRVQLTGAGQPFAVVLMNTGGAAGNILGARVLNNDLDAGPTGTGLLMNIFGSGAAFTAQVEGNDFTGNKVGIDIFGVAGPTGAGNIDLGGGSTPFGISKGANNLRGFTGLSDNFAIYLHNTDAGITVPAHQNTFNANSSPDLVIRDAKNGNGSGTVSATNSLDANHAFVQNLHTRLLGRAATTLELNLWVGVLQTKGRRYVARALQFSTEPLTRIVNNFYVTHLGRSATPAEITKWVSQLKLGTSITQVEASVLGSAEFLTRITSDYVQSVFRQVLGRTATPTEVMKWNGLLPTLGRKGVAAAIINSKEHRLQVVTSFYSELLHRQPTPEEAAALAATPGNYLALKVTVLSSTEFFEHG